MNSARYAVRSRFERMEQLISIGVGNALDMRGRQLVMDLTLQLATKRPSSVHYMARKGRRRCSILLIPPRYLTPHLQTSATLTKAFRAHCAAVPDSIIEFWQASRRPLRWREHRDLRLSSPPQWPCRQWSLPSE